MKNNLNLFITSFFTLLLFTGLTFGCDDGSGIGENEATGTLELRVNGEGFIRDGFTTEDGWDMAFTSVKINITGATAFQAEEDRETKASVPVPDPNFHAGHPEAEIPGDANSVGFVGPWFVELTDDPTTVAEYDNAATGNYNRVNFTIAPVEAADEPEDTEDVGSTIVMKGTATKGADVVNFTIRFDWEIGFLACGPNEEAGVLRDGESAYAELTTHFDHVFGDTDAGDAETTDQESVNFTAIGFDPLEQLVAGGYPKTLDLDADDIRNDLSNALYLQLTYAFLTFGHSGEGHCKI